MAKFTIQQVTELKLYVKTSGGGTSVKVHRFADKAAAHYSDETFGRYVMNIRAGNSPKKTWDINYRNRLYRRSLKVFQKYLPMKEKK